MSKSRIIGIFATVACAGALFAQPGSPRGTARVMSFRSSIDDSTQPYGLYLPHIETGKKYPLLISLHGEESNHRLALRQVFGLPSRAGQIETEDLRFFPAVRDFGFIVAAPLARGSVPFQGISEKDVYDVLADVQKHYAVDPDRIYLAGISPGGGAALRMALTRPDLWAGVVALCPSNVAEAAELAGNLTNVPVRIFQGELDPLVPASQSRAWHKLLLHAGVPVEYFEYPSVRHNIWDAAYRNSAMLEWFSQHTRNTVPKEVQFATRSYRNSSAYWVQVDGITPGQLAKVTATRTATGASVHTSNVEGFTLTLDRPATAVSVDGLALTVKPPAANVSLERVASKWRVGKMAPGAKRLGLEGPISEAFAGRFIYVYGTVGAKSDEELAERRKPALEAAAWSGDRMRQSVPAAVKADSAITAADLDANDVVLFGTPETNSVLARFGANLPIRLNPGAADYGLLFIAPIGKRYALVSSGLPWWTGAEEASRGGPASAPVPYRVLATFPDYVLFKGSLSNVVAEGSFDRNWKVPADASAKLLGAGTVTIHN